MKAAIVLPEYLFQLRDLTTPPQWETPAMFESIQLLPPGWR